LTLNVRKWLSILGGGTRHSGVGDGHRRNKEVREMKYFVLLAGSGEMPAWDALTAEEQQADLERLGAFDEACAARAGVEILAAEPLGEGHLSTTLRTRNGEMTITDGPFAEAAEQIGGFYLIDAPDLDTIVDLCRTLPAYDIDIRPVADMG
jgi:hypothetical protein